MKGVVVAEGRRMMRLAQELTPETFDALLEEYGRLLRAVFEGMDGRDVDVRDDTAMAAFPTAREAALAAVAVQRAVASHDWPGGSKPAISVGIHSTEAPVSWSSSAVAHCEQLCDAAEGGQIFLSPATRALLETEDLGELRLMDVGEPLTRRTKRRVRAYALVVPGSVPHDP